MPRHTGSRFDSLSHSGPTSLLHIHPGELSPHLIPNMKLYSQPGPLRIHTVALNTGRRAHWVAEPPDPARRQQIQSILRRGVGHVPGLTRSYVSVSIDAGCAQLLFMRALKELLLSGLAWAPGSSGSLWQWLLVFSEVTQGPFPISCTLKSWSEPTASPWLATFYCAGISSLTPREAATLATFHRDLVVTLIDWATSQN